MKPGDKVEVNQVWAGGSLIPLRSWFKGYEFVRTEGVNAIVKHTEGMYKGIDVRYPVVDVRACA
jgi:hypothetical protein